MTEPRRIGLLVSAYRPPDQLIRLMQELGSYGFVEIIVVDDGSPRRFQDIFSKLKRTTILSHPKNLGKGEALKTGFRYFHRRHPKSTGLVTADADGQHLAGDILKVADALKKNPRRLILGSRRFGDSVPLRNRIGHFLIRLVLKRLMNISLADTQTGLRGIPTSLLPVFFRLPSGRYEFELDFLMTAIRNHCKTLEVPISAVYMKDDNPSHFRPIGDSMRIGWVILKAVFLRDGK